MSRGLRGRITCSTQYCNLTNILQVTNTLKKKNQLWKKKRNKWLKGRFRMTTFLMLLSNAWRNVLQKTFPTLRTKRTWETTDTGVLKGVERWFDGISNELRSADLYKPSQSAWLNLHHDDRAPFAPPVWSPLLWPSATRMSLRLQCRRRWGCSSLARGLCLHSLSLRKPRMKEHHCMCRRIPFTVHTRAQSQTCAASSGPCTVDWIAAKIQPTSLRLHVSLTNTSLRFGQVLEPELDYIPESN